MTELFLLGVVALAVYVLIVTLRDGADASPPPPPAGEASERDPREGGQPPRNRDL